MAEARGIRDIAAAEDLRVLCLVPSIPLGGMERASIRLMEALARRGAETAFITEARWGGAVRARIEAGGGRQISAPFVTDFSRPKSGTQLAWSLRSHACSARDLRRAITAFQPRALLATSLGSAYFARREASRADRLSVFRLPNAPEPSRLPLKGAADRAIWRAVGAAYDRLVCNSDHTARRLATLLDDDRKIVVIRNIAPDPAPPLTPADADAPRRLVYVGRITEAKGVGLLLEAAIPLLREHADVALELAGPEEWRDGFGAAIRAEAAQSGLGSRIRFLGEIDDVQERLRGAAAHLCPSISQGDSAPNAILDAKRAGAPTIATPIAGLPELVRHERDGLVAAAPTAEALRAEMARLLSDEALRARLAAAAAASIAAHEEETIAARWIALMRGAPAHREAAQAFAPEAAHAGG
ncbi:MAG: glycosyltransferase family 4 protein [Pseudomonadota bacterium]